MCVAYMCILFLPDYVIPDLSVKLLNVFIVLACLTHSLKIVWEDGTEH